MEKLSSLQRRVIKKVCVKQNNLKSQLDDYIEILETVSFYRGVDSQAFWIKHFDKFKKLSGLAVQMLAIPATRHL
ncbi:hypothetical protein A3Q56_03702 [Intoshia linei]|uniref:Uncharacterized protein n=1 Tax=Intoshia linei TaxID=1819745 RepID=A0A177B326_9BILA|nr:hypothetical protein A3Q56_03702 [Intoshia linei]